MWKANGNNISDQPHPSIQYDIEKQDVHPPEKKIQANYHKFLYLQVLGHFGDGMPLLFTTPWGGFPTAAGSTRYPYIHCK